MRNRRRGRRERGGRRGKMSMRLDPPIGSTYQASVSQ